MTPSMNELAMERGAAERLNLALQRSEPLDPWKARPAKICAFGKLHRIEARSGTGGRGGPAYMLVNKVAIIPVLGAMYKGYGFYGFADQLEIQAAVKMAAADPNVSGIMLLIDSPGGSVAGTMETGDAIAAAARAKPTVAYIEDQGCSAAYWLASQAREVYANPSAAVGSIGVITALVDASKFYENNGIKVHQIATGEFKGVGDDTQPVDEKHIDYIRERVDQIYSFFVQAVARGRKMAPAAIRALEAKVFIGAEAKALGLIDGVRTIEHVLGLMSDGKTRALSAAHALMLTQLDEMES